MQDTILHTTFANPQGFAQTYGFLGRGITLAAGESVSILGSPMGMIRAGSGPRRRAKLVAMQHAIQLGLLSVVTVPKPIIWDTTLTNPRALRVDANLVNVPAALPDYSGDPTSIVTTTTAAPTTTTTAGSAPAAPTAPAAALINGGQAARVTWAHAGTGVARYRVQRQVNGGSFVTIGEVLVGNLYLEVDITAFVSGTVLGFKVAAVSPTNVASAYTTVVSVTRP